MATTRRLWVPVLVGCLVAVLFGPAGVTAVEPRTVTAGIMIPAAAFAPIHGGYSYYNDGLNSITVYLRRANPASASQTPMNAIATIDSADNPQVRTMTIPSPRKVNAAFHGPYLRVELGSAVKLYGVRVSYSY
jgi:hypothetical protein